MNDKLENGYYVRSFKHWGIKPKCGCVEFTFDNIGWFTSRRKIWATGVITLSTLVLSCNLFQEVWLKCSLTMVLVLCLVFIAKVVLFVRKETLHVIAPIGVQFITTYAIGQESVLFVPWHSINNFVIVEMIVGQQIFFYLGLQNKTNNNNGLVILFQNTRPRLSYLEEIYRVIIEHSQS